MVASVAGLGAPSRGYRMDYWLVSQIFVSSVIGAALIALLVQLRTGTPAHLGLDAVALPVWAVDADGTELMRNAACGRLGPVELPTAAGRAELAGQWFDIVVRPNGEGQVFSAIPAEAVVRAEGSLRDFRTTMSDTFAQLETGLALFDAQGRLQLFNPAMGELTGLAVEFLARRPSLGAVLDALRDKGTLPEPKEWLAWRRMMVELPMRSGALSHEETWALPGGVTYRMTLRPQAKGSFAMLVEDISTEMIRSRRHRADVELAQAVIDTLEEGIAVFAGSGHLVLSNAAYAELWGHDPAATMLEGTIARMAAHWREVSAPDPLWTRIEDFIALTGEREAWQAEARLRDGRLIACRIAPIWDGATLAAFRPIAPDHAVPEGVPSVARYRARKAG